MYHKTSPKLRLAVNDLGVTLATMKNNEPINRKEGNTKQANLEKDTASSVIKAMRVLAKR
jgi:hypothetical protein